MKKQIKKVDKRNKNHMTAQNFFRYYNILSASEMYKVFFEYKKNIYVFDCTHIKACWCVESRESSSNGGWQKWMMRFKEEYKKEMLQNGRAQKVMTLAEFNAIPYKNRGHRCEYFLHKLYNLPGEYKPDHLAFDLGGDIEIDGIRYQIKFQNASLTNVNTLHNAQARARERKKNEKKN